MCRPGETEGIERKFAHCCRNLVSFPVSAKKRPRTVLAVESLLQRHHTERQARKRNLLRDEKPWTRLLIRPTRSKSSGRLNSSGGCQAAAPSTLSASPSTAPRPFPPYPHHQAAGAAVAFTFPSRPSIALPGACTQRLPIYPFLSLSDALADAGTHAHGSRSSVCARRAAGVLRAIVPVRVSTCETRTQARA